MYAYIEAAYYYRGLALGNKKNERENRNTLPRKYAYFWKSEIRRADFGGRRAKNA